MAALTDSVMQCPVSGGRLLTGWGMASRDSISTRSLWSDARSLWWGPVRGRWVRIAFGVLSFGFAGQILGHQDPPGHGRPSVLVNGDRFAQHINQMRVTPALASALGDEVATVVVDAKPDLIAVQPAIESAAAAARPA